MTIGDDRAGHPHRVPHVSALRGRLWARDHGRGVTPTAPSTVTRIRGDRDDVFSKGFICPKGSTLRQLHEDPDRLRRPLVKRDGVHVEVVVGRGVGGGRRRASAA